MSLFHLHSQMIFSLIKSWDDSFFSTWKMFCHFLWSPWFLLEICSHLRHISPIRMHPFSLAFLKIIFFVFSCQQLDVFELILLGACWTSWICRFMSFTKVGKYFSSIFFYTTIISVSGTPMRWILDLSLLFHRSLKLCSFFSNFFLLFKLDNFCWSSLTFCIVQLHLLFY